MKKLSAMLLSSTILLATLPTTIQGASFKDVEEQHWASSYIEFLKERKIISGFPDGTFKPEDNTTRLEAILMLLKDRGVTDFSNVKNPDFIDVTPTTYGYKEIAKAVELGIIKGKINGKGQKYFDPNGSLTRGEMASILAFNYGFHDYHPLDFDDVPATHWAYPYVKGLTKNGIAAGYGDGRFGVNDFITRAQFSVMLARSINPVFRIPMPTLPNRPVPPQTGQPYADGWIAPILKSSWSTPDYKTSLNIFKQELGFGEDGKTYYVSDQLGRIKILEGYQGHRVFRDHERFVNYEVRIYFPAWDYSWDPVSYRIPAIAKELFKFYFDKDATTVLNHINNHSDLAYNLGKVTPDDIKYTFNANGRTVDFEWDEKDGGFLLSIEYKK
jgi:S-layer homology domain